MRHLEEIANSVMPKDGQAAVKGETGVHADAVRLRRMVAIPSQKPVAPFPIKEAMPIRIRFPETPHHRDVG